jgi:hypothetical protein
LVKGNRYSKRLHLRAHAYAQESPVATGAPYPLNSLVMKRLLVTAAILATASLASAQLIPITSYSYNTSPDGSYPDSGGVELRDGVTQTVVWGGPVNATSESVVPLVGWRFSDPDVTFEFGAPVTIRSVTVWSADSDGAAGVYLPTAITLTAGAFSQSFTVLNPAGAGTVVPIVLDGFEVTASSMQVFAQRDTVGNNWTMLSEVEFSAIPEPSTYALGGGLLALAAAFLRRRR